MPILSDFANAVFTKQKTTDVDLRSTDKATIFSQDLQAVQNGLEGGFRSNFYQIKLTFNNAKNLKQQLASQIASTNKFFVAGESSLDDNQDTLTWYGICTKARLPAQEMTDVNPYGNYRTVINKSKENLTLGFLDDQFAVNSHFWKILNLFAFDENTGILNYTDEFKINELIITLYTNTWEHYYTYTFKNCFAKTIPEINLSSEENKGGSFDIILTYESYTLELEADNITKYKENETTKAQDLIRAISPALLTQVATTSSGGLFGAAVSAVKKIGTDMINRVAPGGFNKDLIDEGAMIAAIVAENLAINLAALGIAAASSGPNVITNEVATDVHSGYKQFVEPFIKADELNVPALKVGRLEIQKPA